jgi:hypothetical protein
MTESQKAFEDDYISRENGNAVLSPKHDDGTYFSNFQQEALDEVLKSMIPKDSAMPVHIYFTVVERSYAQIGFNAGEAYGRKQALDDLIAAFVKFENNEVAQLVLVKELIKLRNNALLLYLLEN